MRGTLGDVEWKRCVRIQVAGNKGRSRSADYVTCLFSGDLVLCRRVADEGSACHEDSEVKDTMHDVE